MYNASGLKRPLPTLRTDIRGPLLISDMNFTPYKNGNLKSLCHKPLLKYYENFNLIDSLHTQANNNVPVHSDLEKVALLRICNIMSSRPYIGTYIELPHVNDTVQVPYLCSQRLGGLEEQRTTTSDRITA